jgi:hypothetical protein
MYDIDQHILPHRYYLNLMGCLFVHEKEAHKCPGGLNIRCCTSGPTPTTGNPIFLLLHISSLTKPKSVLHAIGCRSFADSQWNCALPSCATRVPAGSPQPQYGCAGKCHPR